LEGYSFILLTDGGRTTVISEDPGGGGTWLEDFVDYPKAFGKIYREGKKVSTTWHSLLPGGLERFPVLGCFEHQVLSFWMQVLRDRLLAESLIDRKNPEAIVLTGRSPDTNRIADCLFDPGLFEYTMALAAKDRGVNIDGTAAPANPVKAGKLGTARALYACWADRLNGLMVGKALKPGGCVLVSRQAASKAGSGFLVALKHQVQVVVTETDAVHGSTTLYETSARNLSPGRRLLEYRELWRLFEQTPEKAWRGRFVCGGHDYWEIARAAIRVMLVRHAWTELFRQQLLEEFIKRQHPLALLVLYDHGLNEAQLVEVCRRHGVRTVTMQHGLANRAAPGYLPIMSDTFACWGEAEKQTLIAQGADPKKLKVTGFPGFDRSWGRPARSKPGKPYRALVATQGVQASVGWHFAMLPTRRLLEGIVAHGLRPGELEYTVRLHPNETLTPEIKQKAEGDGIRITQGLPLEKQFEDHDVVVTQFSTVGVEALLAGLPLVSLNWAGEEEAIPFAESGAAVRSRKPEDLAWAVESAVEGRGKRSEAVAKFLKDHLCRPGAGEQLMGLLIGERPANG
jgi:hypothetical protein